MKLAILLIVAATVVSPLIAGPMGDSPFFSPNLNTIGLLNPNNLRVNHSMSFMSGVSSGGDGFYQSTYTNHLHYSFTPKLDLKVDLNFVNYGTANWDNSFSIKSNNDNASTIIPEFSLNYRPSDNSSITIEFRQSGAYRRSDHWWY